jgi:hypothetical protein
LFDNLAEFINMSTFKTTKHAQYSIYRYRDIWYPFLDEMHEYI